MLAGGETSNPDVIAYQLCKEFHCLPSQLEKEDSKRIQKFILISNEIRQQQEDEKRRVEAEMKLKAGN